MRAVGAAIVVLVVIGLIANATESTDTERPDQAAAAIDGTAGGAANEQRQRLAQQRRAAKRRAAARRAAKQRAEARRKAAAKRAAKRRAAQRAAAERADRQEAERQAAAAPEPVATAEPAEPECDPNYAGACLDPNASDYDCIGGSGDGPHYIGRVTVVGVDHHGLDRDGDGIGCE